MAKSAILSIKILTDASKAQQGMDTASTRVGKFQQGLSKAGKVGAVAFAAVAAAGISAAKAAAEDQQAQVVLAKTLKNTTGATDAQVAATEDWISKTAAATGVADDQLRPALGNLVRATGDVTKSQDAMGVALDVAAATGADVEAVSKALAKGYGGNTKALGKLVPGMDKAVLASGDMSKVMKELQRTTGGAAAAAADTAAGKMQRFQLAMDEAKEGAGSALLPALTALSGVLVTVGNLAQQHSTAFVVLAAAIAAIALAVMAANAAITIYNAVTAITAVVSKAAWLSALGPILLVVAAVALVIGIIVLLWKKSETFRNVVIGVWNAIKTAALATWNAIKGAVLAVINWIKSNWKILLVALTGPLGAAVVLIISNWSKIKAAASSVISWLKGAWSALWDSLKSAARAASSVLTAPFDALHDAADRVIGTIERLIDKIKSIKLPSINIPGVGRIGGSSATAPMATSTGTLARGVGAGTGRAAAPRPALTVVIQGAVDPESTARQVRRLLDRHDGRVGLTGVLRTA